MCAVENPGRDAWKAMTLSTPRGARTPVRPSADGLNVSRMNECHSSRNHSDNGIVKPRFA